MRRRLRIGFSEAQLGTRCPVPGAFLYPLGSAAPGLLIDGFVFVSGEDSG